MSDEARAPQHWKKTTEGSGDRELWSSVAWREQVEIHHLNSEQELGDIKLSQQGMSSG